MSEEPDDFASHSVSQLRARQQERESVPMASLIVRQPGRPDRREELLAEETIIGREANSSVCIDQPSVSRKHARIAYSETDAAHEISDLGSRNGTWLNGKRLNGAPRSLANGDRIHLARDGVVIQYLADEATVTQAAPFVAGLPLVGPEAMWLEGRWRVLWNATPWFKVLAAILGFVSALIPILVWIVRLWK